MRNFVEKCFSFFFQVCKKVKVQTKLNHAWKFTLTPNYSLVTYFMIWTLFCFHIFSSSTQENTHTNVELLLQYGPRPWTWTLKNLVVYFLWKYDGLSRLAGLLKIAEFYKPERIKRETIWKWILTIFNYKN